MKFQFFTISLLLFASLVFAQQAELAPVGGTQLISLSSGQTMPALKSTPNVIFDNGPLVNSPGTGPGGTDQSVLQNVSLGITTLGFGFQTSVNNWMADDFSLTEDHHISSVILYGYQTGSTTTSTITAAYIRIYDMQPNLPGASVIWGDAITNRMTSTQFSGVYRISETNNNTDRPIMEVVCNVDIHLPAGTYWIEFQLDGSLALGPWCPPVTITGEATTGNALQYTSSGYGNAVDGGFGNQQQGAPFVLIGTPNAVVPVSLWYILLVFPLLALVLVIRRRLL